MDISAQVSIIAQLLARRGVVLAVGALLVGALLLVAGYRLWQTTVFALGFLGGGVVIAVIFEKVFKDETWVLTASWIAFVVGGIIVGYICVYLYWVGVFMGGAHPHQYIFRL
ncbi:hypothetical protein P3T76_010698 [Phytophthora citrophthora]|uniref:Transmembrane protein 198 n=1 Tax=Phytophthora citrophthora TaxID=4793 RepID=A0AAD9GBJ4_9STRA|nr:hypothetical protein P3T76_010698 [Phytophthora citrophthora]